MRRHLLFVLCLWLTACERPPGESGGFQVAEALGGVSSEGFDRATEVRPFLFPRDHGPHPAFRNEWWYFTGNLRAEDGRAFGFQATFFRIALRPDAIPSHSAWRSNQIWMGHAALSDLSGKKHLTDERFARQGAGLAGATAEPFRVWLENWQLRDEEDGAWRLYLPANGFELDLTLSPLSPVILQGERGLSQKSAEPGNASYYYSIPRLQAKGRLRRGEEALVLEGLAWFDREWSTGALGPQQVGWDWFSLQLQDGRNLMIYQLRRRNGSIDSHSSGTLSNSSGLQQRLGPGQFTLTPLAYWHSGDRNYPIEWRIHLQGELHPWQIRALLEDQEVAFSVRYWEGAVEVIEEGTGTALGRGYLEMTGY